MPAGPAQLEHAASTRAALVDAGRSLFVSRGYFTTGTEEVVAAAGVTRGALYHHFADKRDLFRAVFNAIGADVLAGRVGAPRPPATGDDPWEQLRLGLHWFVRTAAEEPEVQQVTLIDGPAVLGWTEWTRLEHHYALDPIHAAVDASVTAGVIPPQPSRTLAHLLLGAVRSAALVVANAPDVDTAHADVVTGLDALLTGLRRREP